MIETCIISINTASKKLNVSRTQIYRLIDMGYLKAVFIAEKRMLDEESVNKYALLKDKINEVKIQMKQMNDQ